MQSGVVDVPEERLRERGFSLHARGEWAAAEAAYREVLRDSAGDFEVRHALGVLCLHTGRYGDALDLLTQVPQAWQPAAVISDVGAALLGLQRCEEAIRCFDRAIELQATDSAAYLNRGHALLGVGRPHDALRSFEDAIRVTPDFFEAHMSRADLLQRLSRPAEAIASYRAAAALRPASPLPYLRTAPLLLQLSRCQEALDELERALALGEQSGAVNMPELHMHRATALVGLARWDEALRSFDTALALRERFALAHVGRGETLRQLGRREEAIASLERAIALETEFAEAYFARANILVSLNRYEEALRDYSLAFALKPRLDLLEGARLYAKLQLCSWDGLNEQIASLRGAVERGEPATPPFPGLLVFDSAAVQKMAAQNWLRRFCPGDEVLPAIPKRRSRETIRIGYFSADFRNHPIALLTAPMIERHDRRQFEVHGFSFGPDTGDESRRRMQHACDHFTDVRNATDREVALLARRFEIDIAVDLTGFTEGFRPGIFALRAAPVQISYLGYLGTMGAGFIDYLIADATIVPTPARAHYSEKIIELPGYHANDPGRATCSRRFSRAELGLSDAGIVFCCFNANFKIMPRVFSTWMRILRRVEGSVLFLYADAEAVRTNLRREAADRGVDADRLVFAPRLPAAEYLARLQVADLFLDTLPYNAGTTASDALLMGLPVLTCLGESFAARVAASLLRGLGMPELITRSEQEYEEAAVTLAGDPIRLAGFKQRLEAGRGSSIVFDSARLTRNIEAAYRQVHERYLADLPPDHLCIDAP
jgi:predicted O-linked N-acetylglucosamine transferase (SPINDLY family)